jgi:protocatechuate 3,4-dioxygenase beta subunit
MQRRQLMLAGGALLGLAALLAAWLLRGGALDATAPGAGPPSAPLAGRALFEPVAGGPAQAPQAGDLAGSPATPLALVPQAAASTQDEARHAFLGRVVDGRGIGLTGARLELLDVLDPPPGLQPGRRPGHDLLARTSSGAGGAFRLEVPESLARPRVVPSAGLRPVGFRTRWLRVRAGGHAALVRDVQPDGDGTETDLGTLALEPAAALAGRVTDPDGRPLAGARAVLLRSTDVAAVDALLADAEQARSGPGGEFRLEDLAAGDAVLAILAEGRPPLVEHDLVLEPGELLDLGTLSFMRGSRVAGRVLDEAGAPVADVDVSARNVSLMCGPDLPRARSDAAGRFEFLDLPAGGPTSAVQLVAEAEGWLSGYGSAQPPFAQEVDLRLARAPGVELQVSGPSGAPAPSAVARLVQGRDTLARAEVRDGRAWLALPDDGWLVVQADGAAPHLQVVGRAEVLPAGRLLASLAPEAVLHGLATDAAGAVLAGLRVTAVPHDDRLEELLAPASAVTDAQGRFELRGLAAGGYSLRAERPPFAPARQGVVAAAGEVREVALVLQAGATLEGRVLSTFGTPLAGEAVRAVLPNAPSAPVSTDAGGRFVLAGLRAGSAFVALEDGRGNTRVSLQPGGTTRVELVVPVGGVVTGRVHAAGRPLEDWSVTAREAERGAGSRRSETAHTDAEGAFRFEGLEPQAHLLGVRGPDGRLRASRDVLVVEGQQVTLDVELTDATLLLPVLADEDGTPVPDASVELRSGGAALGKPLLTTPDGRAELAHVPEGTLELAAQAPGRQVARASVEVRAGASDLPVVLRLPVAARLSGRVLVADAGPRVSCRIALEPLEGQPPVEARAVGREGDWSIDHLAPGRWRVSVLQDVSQVPGRVDLREIDTRALELARGEARVLDLVVQPLRP